MRIGEPMLDAANKGIGSEKKESPESKIELPKDPEKYKETIEQLQSKLMDYESRLEHQEGMRDIHKSPEQISTASYAIDDTNFKIAILQEVLLRGKVKAYDLSLKLSAIYEKEGKHFNMRAFDKAFGVIKDYCETGGKNVVWGTGF